MRLYWYKSYHYKTKTFHGVEFKPGETKQVIKPINDSRMIRVYGPEKLEVREEAQEQIQKRSPGRPKKSSKPSIKEKSNFDEESIENITLEESKEESE